MIEQNMLLVYGIINKYFKNNQNKEDLIQVGCIGLIKAYKNFNEEYNTKFSTFAYSYILGEIRKYLTSNNTLKYSNDMKIFKKKVMQAYDLLNQKYGRNPTIKELSLFLELDEQLIIDIINSNSEVYSLDAQVDDFSLYDVQGKSYDLDTKLDFENMLSKLNEFERELINSRYYDDLTQSETAEKLGISQVQVSRNEKKILMKLKNSYVS